MVRTDLSVRPGNLPYMKRLAGVLELAREVFIEEIKAAVPKNGDSPDDAEGCRDPNAELREQCEVDHKSTGQKPPDLSGIDLQNEDGTENGKCKKLHKPIKPAHKPAGCEKKGEFRVTKIYSLFPSQLQVRRYLYPHSLVSSCSKNS